MQLLLKTKHSCEEYVSGERWKSARLTACPCHPEGRCGFKRLGYYARKTPYGGALIARYYCPKAQRTFSLLPQFFAAWITGELRELEAQAESCDELGVEAASQRRAPDGKSLWWSVSNWLGTRIEQLRWVLQLARTILGELSDVPVEIRPLRAALGEPELLVALRLKLEDQLQQIAYPIGFRREKTPVGSKRGPPNPRNLDGGVRTDQSQATSPERAEIPSQS